MILARNYGAEGDAVFLPYHNVGKIQVIADGEENGQQHYSVIFYDNDGDELTRNQGFPSFDRAVQAVQNMGINCVICG